MVEFELSARTYSGRPPENSKFYNLRWAGNKIHAPKFSYSPPGGHELSRCAAHIRARACVDYLLKRGDARWARDREYRGGLFGSKSRPRRAVSRFGREFDCLGRTRPRSMPAFRNVRVGRASRGGATVPRGVREVDSECYRCQEMF